MSLFNLPKSKSEGIPVLPKDLKTICSKVEFRLSDITDEGYRLSTPVVELIIHSKGEGFQWIQTSWKIYNIRDTIQLLQNYALRISQDQV